MSAYPPPTETLPIFNVNEFIGTTSTSQGGGGGTFVNYPTAQGSLNLVGFNSSGTASITNLVVNGTSDINNNVNISGDIVFDGINGSINFLDTTEQVSAYTGAGALVGAYTNSNITLDADGKITAISNGSGVGLNPTFDTITIQDPLAPTNTSVISQTGSDFTITNNEIASVIQLIADTTEVQDLNADSVLFSIDGTSQTSAYTGAGALTGSYTNTNMTIDTNGKITALANGSAPVNLLPLNNTWTGTNDFTLTTTLSTATFADSTSQTSAFTGAGALSGTYTSTNMTIDANGKITALANGSSSGGYDDDLSVVYPLDLMTKQLAQVPTWNFTNTQPLVVFSGIRAMAMSANGQYCLVAQNTIGAYVRRSSNYANPKNVDNTLSWEIVSTLADSFIVGVSPNGQYQFYSDGITMYYDNKFGKGGFVNSVALPSGQSCASGYIRTSATGKYVWCYYQSASAGISIIYKSVNYGASWTQFQFTSAVQTFETYPQSKIAVSASGKYVSYAYQSGGNDCRYKRSTDYGNTFTQVASATLGFVMSGICMNMIGDILIANAYNASNTTGLFYISRDYGASWSALTSIPNTTLDSFSSIECCGMGQTIIVGNNTSAGAYVSYDYGQTWNALGTNAPRRNACLSANGGFCWGMNNASSILMVIYNVPIYTPVVAVAQTYPVLATGTLVAPSSQTIYLPFGLLKHNGDGLMDINSYFTCRITFTMVWKPTGYAGSRTGFCSYGGDIQFFPYRWTNGYGGSQTGTGACSQSLVGGNLFALAVNNNYNTSYAPSTSNENMDKGRAFWLYNDATNGMGGDAMGFFLGVICSVDANGVPNLMFKCMSPYWLGGTPSGDVEMNYTLDLLNNGNMPTTSGSYITTFGMGTNWKFYY